MKARSFALVLVCATPFAASSISRAAVIDFNAITVGWDILYIPAIYEEDGFLLDVDATSPTVRSSAFGMFGTSDPGFTGTNSLFLEWQGPVYSLTQAGGAPFDFFSIDIWEWRNQPDFLSTYHADVTFTGHVVGGSTVQQMISANGIWDSETFTFPAFRNLLSVEWDVKNGFAALHQFDNIVVAPVPEPPSWLLLAVAAVMIAVFRMARPATARRVGKAIALPGHP